MRQIIGYIDTGAIFGYSSVVTLTEVLIQPKRVGNNSLQDQYRDLLLHSRNFNLLSVNAAMAESAADLRVRYNLRTPDALQIATALAADCQAFLTNDLDLKRVSELQILVVEELVSVTQG